MKSVKRKRRFLLLILFFTTDLFIVSVSSAEENTHGDWAFTLSLGAFHGTEYEGSDEAEITAAPNFEVVWKDRVFLNLDSLGINYYASDLIILNAIASQGEERKESLNASFNGLGDIDASTSLTLGAEFNLDLFISSANLTKHIGGTDGIQANIGLETSLPLRMLTGNLDMDSIESMGETEALKHIGPIVTLGLSVDWADDDYTGGFYSVDAGQSARSGLPQYTAEAGFKSFNLGLDVLYFVNKSWTVQGLAGYSEFIGDAKDSPIVKDDDDVFVGGFINYHF